MMYFTLIIHSFSRRCAAIDAGTAAALLCLHPLTPERYRPSNVDNVDAPTAVTYPWGVGGCIEAAAAPAVTMAVTDCKIA